MKSNEFVNLSSRPEVDGPVGHSDTSVVEGLPILWQSEVDMSFGQTGRLEVA